jgi:hypothetical protein
VTVRLIHWRGALPRAVLLAAAAMLVPVPGMASDAKDVTKRKTIQVSMQEIVKREAARTPAVRATATRAQTNTSKESPGFFRSGPGMVALAVMIAGTGYALYSASHDRVHSPAAK